MRRLRPAFRALTFVLLALCIWTAYANVLSDDTAVRARAGELARTTAGCGDRCRVVGMDGDRGMISETIAFDIEGKGRVVVTCRRPFIAFGDHECTAEGPGP